VTLPIIQPTTQPNLRPSFVRPAQPGNFAVGLGLTNECNLACSFCYRDPTRVDRLSLEQVQAAMASLPVRSVNLGTGENGMHPEFREILGFLRTLPVKLTITSRSKHSTTSSFHWTIRPKKSRMPSAAQAIGR
jgi:MoaA/NifB/PqqE/SkfB family radical SAM enzyme